MTVSNSTSLSQSDLEAYDPHGGRTGGANRRYLCPLCGDSKKRDTAHRSLSLEAATGLWNCWRCGAKGQLVEHRAAQNGQGSYQGAKGRATRQRAQLSRLQTHVSEKAPQDETDSSWRERLRGLEPLAGTPGAAYLDQRGIPVDVAALAGVRFAPDWFGRPGVVFPIRDRSGALVAAQGRHTTGTGKMTCGPKSRGVFFAPTRIGDDGKVFRPFDESAPAIVVCEAPIDALSLAACGVPALALCGTSGPSWFHLACGLNRVLLAFDGDEPGDAAAEALAGVLVPFGVRCERVRPDGAKDWNEALQAQGCDALADWLQAQL